MASIDNFKDKIHTLTVKEQSEGGKASVKVRQERKKLKEELLLLLEEGDTQKNVTLALIKRAASGDTKAFEVIRDTIGEKPVEKVQAEVGVTNIEVDVDE